MYVSPTGQISSFKDQIWKLIHPLILTQYRAHKMDSERFVHGRQNEISDLPTWTKDKNSTLKGIACHLNGGGSAHLYQMKLLPSVINVLGR